ncbi:siderophore-interacting protein [Vibrio sp. HA2012]|uniref:siderophore-interacting protein n=1 Tax=Vibrio sp. HA2012 TaxID=1971595 RepID=UPI000C2C3F61|nr:siderophore-interacting protein [Vibrio sp. HA2012]PJC86954.1 siderophore-interacting protein [Vibrio sp. HA2012]
MKRKARLTQVVEVIDLSPHLRRIVVGGEGLAGFPVGQEGAYVKVIVPKDGERMPCLDLTNVAERPTMRSYTIRSFDAEHKRLVMDFVVNRHQGPATDWAINARIGDYVGIAGPGPVKLTNFSESSYLLIGDITSVNAINGYVPRINADACVQVVIVVPTREDAISLDIDDMHTVHWLVEDEMDISLVQMVRNFSADIPPETEVFLGLEAKNIRALRPFLQDELGICRSRIHAVGYWKCGVNADTFSLEKKARPL